MNDFLRRYLFLPPQSSSVASSVDHLHYFVIITTMLGAVVVTLVGGYFIIRYRRRSLDVLAANPDANAAPPGIIKLGVMVSLIVLFLVWWVIGVDKYVRLRVAPPDTLDVYVTAKQWMWKFGYPQGARSIATLVVPYGRPIKLVMTSRDVIHSFFVPDFRVKQDVIPGRYTTLWFEAVAPGTYPILCAEYCGTAHSMMRGEVVALRPEEFEQWLAGNRGPERRVAGPRDVEPSLGLYNAADPREEVGLAREGERIAAEQGCFRCHTTDGTPHIGPTWAGLWYATVPLEGGGEVVADEGYITESMMDPKVKIHRGYQDVMPSYLGRLRAPDTAAIVEFIKSLKDVKPEPGARTPLRAQPSGPPLEDDDSQGKGERRAPPKPEPPGGEIKR